MRINEEKQRRGENVEVRKEFHRRLAGASRYFRIFRILLFVLLSGAVVAQNTKPQSQKPEKKDNKPKLDQISSHVIIISVSGLRANDINKTDSRQIRIPTIQTLRAQGAYAVNVESVYPSLTGPAHATIVTGTLPADHGIASDFPFDEQSGTQSQELHFQSKEIKTETIWDLAKRGGFITSAVGFPLTAGATIDFNLPVNFDENSSSEAEATRTQSFSQSHVQPPELQNQFTQQLKTDLFVENKKLKEIAKDQKLDFSKAVAAAYLIEKHRPNLLMVNFSSFARAEQRYGLSSPESVAALEFVDDLIKKIVDSVKRGELMNETTLIVVSDYGVMRVDQVFNPNCVLAKKGLLMVDGQGRITSWQAVAQTFGGSAAIFIQNPQDEKTSREIEKVFNEYFEKPDSPLWRIISRRESSQLGADPHAAFYLDAAPLYAMSPRANGSIISKVPERAAHGYLPSRSEMRTTLIISGKGIKQGTKIEYARLIDIAPTVARLFGLEMRTARGRVLSEVIAQ